jgi:hypothetical protein
METTPGSNMVSVVAAPNSGSMFIKWTGCDAISTTNPANPGDTCTVNVTSLRTITARFQQAPGQMYVSRIDPAASPGTRRYWLAQATVYITGDNGYAVPNVTVTGEWRDGGNQQVVTCVTDYQGLCSVYRSARSSVVTFTVTDVMGANIPYNPAASVVTSVDVYPCMAEGEVCE